MFLGGKCDVGINVALFGALSCFLSSILSPIQICCSEEVIMNILLAGVFVPIVVGSMLATWN